MAEPPREKAAQATDGTSGTTSDSAGSSSGSVSPDITGDAAQLRNVNVAALEIAVSGAIPARCPFSGMPLTGMSLSRRSGDALRKKRCGRHPLHAIVAKDQSKRY